MNSSGGRLSPQHLLLAGWIAWIFFSSTGIAGRWANELYALFAASSDIGGGISMFVMQKGYHVLLFAVLGSLLVSLHWPRPNVFARAVIWTFVIGALSEALQLAFEGRGPSLADVALNGISGSLAAWICIRLLTMRQRAAPKAAS